MYGERLLAIVDNSIVEDMLDKIEFKNGGTGSISLPINDRKVTSNINKFKKFEWLGVQTRCEYTMHLYS